MCVDRSGVVGQDGETHQGIFDLSFFKLIPNITIMAPKDFIELEDMMEFAVKLKAPVVIRYPRGGEAKPKFNTHSKILYKRCDILTKGYDVTIIAIGNQVSKAMNIFYKLKKEGISANVINARFLKPIDKYEFVQSIKNTRFVVTIEDNTLVGGLASSINEIIATKHLKDITVRNFGYPDVFVEHGSVDELEKKYKLDEETIFESIKKEINYRRKKDQYSNKKRKLYNR